MSKFNEFTKAFDKAVGEEDVPAAQAAMVNYVRGHSEITGKPVAESMKLTRAWMGCGMGDNREATTRNTPNGQEAIKLAYEELGLQDGVS